MTRGIFYLIYGIPLEKRCITTTPSLLSSSSAATAEYASTLLYSDWLFLYGIVLNGFSDLLKNIWKKNYRFSIRNWYCSLYRFELTFWPLSIISWYSVLNVSDGLMYWQEKQEDSKPNDNPWWRPYYRPRSADIEITAYALLAFSLNNDISVGLAISRWLSQQRNSLGGYSSTQVLSLM